MSFIARWPEDELPNLLLAAMCLRSLWQTTASSLPAATSLKGRYGHFKLSVSADMIKTVNNMPQTLFVHFMLNAFPTLNVKTIYGHTQPPQGAVTMVTVHDSGKERTSSKRRRPTVVPIEPLRVAHRRSELRPLHHRVLILILERKVAEQSIGFNPLSPAK